MANKYTDILTLVNAGNQMGLSNTIKRDYGIPLDFTSVQANLDEAVKYAATSTLAYVGQPIAVGDKLYIISDVASTIKYTIGEVEYDNYLKEVGTVPTGDEASITVTAEGLVSMFGFAGAQDGMLPVREDGKLTWKTLEAIGAGDGNDNTTYQFTLNDAGNGIVVTPLFNGQPIYEGEGEDATQVKYEVVLDVYTKGEADEKFLAKADYTPYDDTDLCNRVKALEEEERYDETPLANRVTALEETVGNAEAGLVKDVADNATAIANEKTRAEEAEAKVLEDAKAFTSEQIAGLDVAIEKKDDVDYLVIKNASGEEVASVDATPFIKDGMLDSAVYNTETKKLVLTWNTDAGKTSTEIDLNGLVDTYTGGTGITVGTDGVISVDDTIATVEALNGVKATAEAAQTAEQVAQAIATAIADYAKTSDVNSALYLKADKTDLDNYYTKDDVDGKGFAVATEVAETYATKQELTDHANTIEATLAPYAKTEDVNDELAKKVDSAEISHSTDTIAEGVSIVDGKLSIVVDAYTKAETLTKIQEKITEINGGESAGEVLGQLNSYKETNDARVGAIETKDGEQDTAIAKAQEDATKALADADTANKAVTALASGQVNTNKNDIAAIITRLGTVETTSGSNQSALIALTGRVEALEAEDIELASQLGTLAGNISKLETTLTAKDAELTALIAGNTTEIGKKANSADVYTKTEVDTLLANLDQSEIIADIEANATAIAENKTAIQSNTTAIVALVGNDAGMSARDIAKDELNTLIKAADPENGVSIDDINALVSYVDENAGEIAKLISTTDSNTAKLAGITTTVTDYVASAINAIVMPKASDEVTVATDGTLGIGTVNVNKLTQTEGDTLILNGGTA